MNTEYYACLLDQALKLKEIRSDTVMCHQGGYFTSKNGFLQEWQRNWSCGPCQLCQNHRQGWRTEESSVPVLRKTRKLGGATLHASPLEESES